MTLNLASGRGPGGAGLGAAALGAALAPLLAPAPGADGGPEGGGDGRAPDVVALQEVDTDQPRSGRVDQAAVAAAVMGAADWRRGPALAGTPGLRPDWVPLAGTVAGGPAPSGGPDEAVGAPGAAPVGPQYGVALLVAAPVVAWRALDLGTGRGRLPLPVRDPASGRPALLSFPDEPRTALAAVLASGAVVVATHLSFAPPTAVRQLRALRRWALSLAAPGAPVLVAGDLNLPAPVVAALGARPLVRAATFPGRAPRLQLDHVASLRPGGAVAATGRAVSLDVGDHRALVVDVTAS